MNVVSKQLSVCVREEQASVDLSTALARELSTHLMREGEMIGSWIEPSGCRTALRLMAQLSLPASKLKAPAASTLGNMNTAPAHTGGWGFSPQNRCVAGVQLDLRLPSRQDGGAST